MTLAERIHRWLDKHWGEGPINSHDIELLKIIHALHALAASIDDLAEILDEEEDNA